MHARLRVAISDIVFLNAEQRNGLSDKVERRLQYAICSATRSRCAK